MKNTMKIIGIIALVAVVMFSIAACNRSSAAAPVVTDETNVSAGKVDKYLADLEKLVDEMAPLAAMLEEGDIEALNALQAILEKIEALTEEFGEFDASAFTPEQLQKLMDISDKID